MSKREYLWNLGYFPSWGKSYHLDKLYSDALNLFETEIFNQNNLLSAKTKKHSLEDVNRPQIVESLANDKRI